MTKLFKFLILVMILSLWAVPVQAARSTDDSQTRFVTLNAPEGNPTIASPLPGSVIGPVTQTTDIPIYSVLVSGITPAYNTFDPRIPHSTGVAAAVSTTKWGYRVAMITSTSATVTGTNYSPVGNISPPALVFDHTSRKGNNHPIRFSLRVPPDYDNYFTLQMMTAGVTNVYQAATSANTQLNTVPTINFGWDWTMWVVNDGALAVTRTFNTAAGVNFLPQNHITATQNVGMIATQTFTPITVTAADAGDLLVFDITPTYWSGYPWAQYIYSLGVNFKR